VRVNNTELGARSVVEPGGSPLAVDVPSAGADVDKNVTLRAAAPVSRW